AHIHLPWMRLNSYFEGPHGAWRGTWKMDGGGSLSNQGIHCVDLLQWLAGPVHSVCGFHGVFNHPIEAEDQAVAILKFESGALGTLYTTTCANPDQPFHLYMYGTKGSFSRRGERLEYFEMGSPKDRERMKGVTGGVNRRDTAGLDPLALSIAGHILLIEDLVKAIRTGREPAITIESAKHSVEIVTAVYQSSRTGRAVEIAKLRE
ncbi:MAG: Gfo/Idh/MocA family oxidoreductase, partial [Candidatus Hydrogenedentes bacterium]|nr:Gfo/Idh/MocA family oxidoreductase [Candidatus Hydrogenedentota bacterium]